MLDEKAGRFLHLSGIKYPASSLGIFYSLNARELTNI